MAEGRGGAHYVMGEWVFCLLWGRKYVGVLFGIVCSLCTVESCLH